jgi:SPP1 gp7 family putative phage head morphogenesis protein|tara:strand:+ start:485 stop:958 length:474 start_codon:yes stop_codon:yes gene_type:complete
VPDLQITIANLISTSATQTALSIEELVTTMRLAGMTDNAIKETLLRDLKEGGILFGTFRNKMKNTVKSAVEFSANGSANGAFTKAGVQEFKWVSVGDNRVCPDCEGRHGETGTMEFFETIGLPASGFSVCTTNCRCQLVPENYKGENLDKPLIKQKN